MTLIRHSQYFGSIESAEGDGISGYSDLVFSVSLGSLNDLVSSVRRAKDRFSGPARLTTVVGEFTPNPYTVGGFTYGNAATRANHV